MRKRLLENYSYDVGARGAFPEEVIERVLEDVVFV